MGGNRREYLWDFWKYFRRKVSFKYIFILYESVKGESNELQKEGNDKERIRSDNVM